MQTRREENRGFFLDFREEKFEGKNPISVVLSPNGFFVNNNNCGKRKSKGEKKREEANPRARKSGHGS